VGLLEASGRRLSGSRAGNEQIANLRDPLASLYCVLTGLSRTTGTSSITFTQPF
jgi:hypothetical protein